MSIIVKKKGLLKKKHKSKIVSNRDRLVSHSLQRREGPLLRFLPDQNRSASKAKYLKENFEKDHLLDVNKKVVE